MIPYCWEIAGTPVAKARPRATAVGGHARMYTPKQSKNFEFQIRSIVSKRIKEPIKGAVRVDIEFYLQRPKKIIWKTKPMPRCYCDKRPDKNKLAKTVLEGINGIAFRDDGQIADLRVKKYYCEGDGHPRTIINVKPL